MVEMLKKENGYQHFKVKVGAEEFNEALEKAYKKMRHMFNVPGFRKGKVPRKIVENNYGVEVFYEDALNIVLPPIVEKAVDEMNLDTIDKAELVDIEEIKKDQPFEVEFKVELYPDVEVKDFDKLDIEERKYEVTEELINQQIEQEIEKNARQINVDDEDKAKNDDVVNINFEGFADGKAFEGGKAENHNLKLGSKSFIEGFEDQIIGHKKGDEFTIDVKFPEDYAPELAGKDAQFKIKINGITRFEKPEFDDEFVKDISELDTVSEYKNDLKKRLEDDFAKRQDYEESNLLIDALVDNVNVNVPDTLINRQVDTKLNEMAMELKRYGLELEDYLKSSGQTLDSAKKAFRPAAEKEVKSQLAIDAYAKKNEIKASEKDIDDELNRAADEYVGDDEKKAKYREALKNNFRDDIEQAVVRRKAIDLLKTKKNYVAKTETEEKTEEDKK